MSAASINSAAVRRERVLKSIETAARLARRDPADVSVIAVSKMRSAEEIEALIEAGQREFGESRVQEAQQKWSSLVALRPDIRLHLIGRLQSNKAFDAVRLFDTIHSVDRLSLLDAIVEAARKADRLPSIYVQVNIGNEPQKGGVAVNELPQFIERVRATPLPLAGLMGIPPANLEPAPYFALLAKLARRHGIAGLSMGMSSDYPTAVMLGATSVRIGSALFEGPD